MNEYFSRSGNDLKIQAENVFCTDWEMDNNRRQEFEISGIQDIKEALKTHLKALGITDEAQIEAVFLPSN